MTRFRSNLLIISITIFFYLDQVLNANAYNDDKYARRYYYGKNSEVASKMRDIPESMSKGKGIIGKFGKYKTEIESPRKEVFKAADIEVSKSENQEKTIPKSDVPLKLPKKISPVKQNETEAEKAERIHRTFEKLLTFVEIVGQVDNYVSTKWKNLVKTVSNLYDEEDESDYRLGLKKFKGCPAFIKET